MRLDLFDNSDFNRGTSRLREALWLFVSGVLVSSWVPGSIWRRVFLRAFGAQLGVGVVIKPGVRVKFPWRLNLGDHVWIGEDVWIDNLAHVAIGSHSCISQGAYICTGSHNWFDKNFTLITKPIVVEEECWIGARAILAPGTIMESGSVLTMGSIGKGKLSENHIFSGNPALVIKKKVPTQQ